MNDTNRNKSYLDAANSIDNTILNTHWNGSFITQDMNQRPVDASVIVSLNLGQDFIPSNDIQNTNKLHPLSS